VALQRVHALKPKAKSQMGNAVLAVGGEAVGALLVLWGGGPFLLRGL